MSCDLALASDLLLDGSVPKAFIESDITRFDSEPESVFPPHQLKQVIQNAVQEKVAFFTKGGPNMTNIITHLLRNLENHPLADEIAQKNAFFVVDLGVLVRKFEEFVTALPMVKPHYAVKCNPNPTIIQLLVKLGVNFDCASTYEIDLVSKILAADSDVFQTQQIADRIIFANAYKPIPQLRHARKVQVKRMTFDCEEELYKIAREYPDSHLLLRIATNDAHSLVQLSSKFGAQEKDIPHLLNVGQSLNLNVVGVAFHVGSGCSSAHSYIEALDLSKRVFQLAHDLGMPGMTVLDIGGGFPGFENEAKVSFPEIVSVIAPVLERDFAQYEIIAEPGRFFVGQCHTLVNQITSRKIHRSDDHDSVPQIAHYIMGDGVYNSFKNRVLYDISFDDRVCADLINNDQVKDNLIPSTLWGPTCDSLDQIAKNIMLPECQIGDWLYWINMGAYTTSLAGDFNGFGRSPVVYIATI